MIDLQNRYRLQNRYLFKGQLVMQTALHIGGGEFTLSPSDSPVIRTQAEIPFIPGSSFKGALRSTVEKLIPMLPPDKGFRTCSLIEISRKEFEGMSKEQRRSICPTVRQWDIVQQRRDDPEHADEIMNNALEALCDTCRLFGSPYAASRVNISDLYMPVDKESDIVQIRDGVAIDRDSERAREGLKYDFEVVPVGATFDLEITLENATDRDLQLLCMGLSEYMHGFGVIGGKRSRGLGACKLENLQVYALQLDVDEPARSERLRDYLLRRKFSSVEAGESFLEGAISSIFERR